MKEYVVYEGKVTEVVDITGYWNKRMTFKTKCGVQYAGANSDYRCDENGKSMNTGEYYNFMDDFFPWVNGILHPEIIKNRIATKKMSML